MSRIRRFSLVELSVEHPRWVLLAVGVITLVAAAQLPRVTTDTNPKNMLPKTSDVRRFNDEVNAAFSLYEDTIVVGIVNDRGVVERPTLEKVKRITEEVLKIKGVASRDVSSFTTVDDVTVEGGVLKASPLMTAVPRGDEELRRFRESLLANPLLKGRMISADGKTTAIYVPLEKGANGKAVADQIRAIVRKESGEERFYVAGDPVTRDTFGVEMFKLMAIFAPIAGLLMFAVRYLMFGDLFLSVALMMDAMIAIVWSMGLLIGLGFPIHIMSSMAPVFLMAIATDSIHIFNEFYFRYRETRDRKAAILETMRAVGRPVRYTALATAAGFVVLVFMNIVPVRVFGGLVAFGTVALRVLSFSFIPAMFCFVKVEHLEKASRGEEESASGTSRLLRGLAGLGVRRPWGVVLTGAALLAVAAFGMSRIRVNNNMVEWFKPKSDVRVADRVLNASLGGTSLAYVVAEGPEDDSLKTPEALRSLEDLQRRLEALPAVGKTTSVVDYVKRINRVLHGDNPSFDVVPDSRETISQYLFLFGMSAKPSTLDNVVDYPFRRANIWVQLKTWDAAAMRAVLQAVQGYETASKTSLRFKPAGIAYFNLVWNDEVLWDMVRGFVVSLLAVLAILAFDFRSLRWAVVAYIPLVSTVMLIYGVVGFLGKDFDMPISVLSCLSLGMAVDFAIHFVTRLRQRLAEAGGGAGRAPDLPSLVDALLWTAARPGKGILRNALLFASAFSVMMLAPLTPYVTVGAFIVSMMVLSALMTILYLPGLIVLLRGWLFAASGTDRPKAAA